MEIAAGAAERVAELPGEGATPFTWRSMADFSREAVVQLLDDVLQPGLPDPLLVSQIAVGRWPPAHLPAEDL